MGVMLMNRSKSFLVCLLSLGFMTQNCTASFFSSTTEGAAGSASEQCFCCHKSGSCQLRYVCDKCCGCCEKGCKKQVSGKHSGKKTNKKGSKGKGKAVAKKRNGKEKRTESKKSEKNRKKSENEIKENE
jgi:hypothetical protein